MIKGKCEECYKRDVTVVAMLRPLDWDGVGDEPLERLQLCDECLDKMPDDDVVSVRPYQRKRKTTKEKPKCES